jgi:hypothetical protein
MVLAAMHSTEVDLNNIMAVAEKAVIIRKKCE